MSNFGVNRNRADQDSVRIVKSNTNSDNLKLSAEKCYCFISRSVNASIKKLNSNGVDHWETFLDINIVASCDSGDERDHQHITHSADGTISFFHSFKKTRCEKECTCDLVIDENTTVSKTSVCVGGLTEMKTSLSINRTPDTKPEWAATMEEAGSVVGPYWETKVAEDIAKAQGGWREWSPSGALIHTTRDRLGFAPYDSKGHPYCSSLKKKGCCESTTQFGTIPLD